MESHSAFVGAWAFGLVLASAVVLVGCDGPLPPETQSDASDDRALLTAAIVSNPVTGVASTSVTSAISLSLAGTSGVVYVALPPGSIPDAEQAAIRNRRTGILVTIAMLDGGFDPAPVTAEAGDTLDVDIRVAGTTLPTPYMIVVPERRPPVVVRTDPPPKKRDVPLNATMLIVFSEPIDPATLTDSSVQLSRGGVPVAGSLAFGDAAHLTVTFVPAEPLVAGGEYTLVVTQAIEDLDGDVLEAPVTVVFWGPPLPGLTVSNPGGPAGIVYASLRPWSSDGEGVVIQDRRTGTQATAEMVNGGFDPIPIAATTNDTLDFRIDLAAGMGPLEFFAVVPALRPPRVVRAEPAAGQRDVATTAVPMIVFSEPIDAASLTVSSLQLLQGLASVAGTLAFGDAAHLTVTFVPAEPLASGTEYTLFATTVITDLDGDALETAATVGFATLGSPLPPGGQLAFARDGQIYQVDPDGTGLVRLSDGPGDAYPAWSPDGRRIAFSSARGASAESTAIYIMDADGSNVVRRVTARYGQVPSWSSDGTSIVYAGLNSLSTVTSGAGSLDLYVIHADDDGSSPIDLTEQQGYEGDPAWSPDGARIAFVSDWTAFDFTSDVYLTGPTGSERIQLTDGFGPGESLIQYYQPAWSPDGQRLAVVTCHLAFETCSASTVSLMNADGSGLTQLAATIGFARPTWSPDGRTIAFESSGSIYWVSADGSTRGMIIADGHGPAWRP